ncbi:hypothetical protein FH972_008023 [Carpinus fangiana]|uniref:Uncharacterized protein n=1 Tax=Carpinus fangiana TaxID=176857 RepID=A0A5N6QXE0_9ROSI|nr:hypothetical protein FH972_008023 [Carpinus fangiana]
MGFFGFFYVEANSVEIRLETWRLGIEDFAAGEPLCQIFGVVGVWSRWVAYLHYHPRGAVWQWVKQLRGLVEEGNVADGGGWTMFIQGCAGREGNAREIEIWSSGTIGNSGIHMEKRLVSFARKMTQTMLGNDAGQARDDRRKEDIS